ncbi:general stress protein [Virgibacillus kimchii]
MTKEIAGVYDSLEETIRKVENLELKGHDQKKIAVITNSRKINELDEETDVKVRSGIPEKDTDSFKDKIVELFTDDTVDPYIHLMEFGIPEEQAKVHQGDLKSGKMIVTLEM